MNRRVGEVFCRQTLLLEKHLLMQEEGILAVSIWTKGIPGRQTEQMEVLSVTQEGDNGIMTGTLD